MSMRLNNLELLLDHKEQEVMLKLKINRNLTHLSNLIQKP